MKVYRRLRTLAWLCALGLMLWPAASALAQNAPSSVQAKRDCDDNVIVDWSSVSGVSNYRVSYLGSGDSGERQGGSTGKTSLSLGKLGTGTYTFFVDTDQGTWGSTVASLHMSNCPIIEPPPPHFNCAEIPHRVVVHAIGSDTHCHSVVPGGLGDPSLLAAGVLDAIDLWGSNSTVRFCFQQPGRLAFVDTAVSPRVTSGLAAEQINGTTCGTVDRTGMVVLLRADDTPVVSADTSTVEPESEIDSDDICRVTTTARLSLRAGPSVFYARLDAIPIGTRLLASGRNGDWFLVKYEGQWGWSSDAFLTQSGDCDAIGGSSRVYLPVETPPAPVEEEAQEEIIAPEPEPTAAWPLELTDCRLTAGDIINLRTAPGVENPVQTEIPFLSQLIATERWGDWFKVEYEGTLGWVNLDYVFRRGSCG